jgi:hypothetical protein
MFSTAKCALVAALVLAATFPAPAATKAGAMQRGQAAAYDVIPGYGKDGGRVAVPNPDR